MRGTQFAELSASVAVAEHRNRFPKPIWPRKSWRSLSIWEIHVSWRSFLLIAVAFNHEKDAISTIWSIHRRPAKERKRRSPQVDRRAVSTCASGRVVAINHWPTTPADKACAFSP
jgi:hypothetical protein